MNNTKDILQAFIDGKKLELYYNGRWEDAVPGVFNDKNTYRIKQNKKTYYIKFWVEKNRLRVRYSTIQKEGYDFVITI